MGDGLVLLKAKADYLIMPLDQGHPAGHRPQRPFWSFEFRSRTDLWWLLEWNLGGASSYLSAKFSLVWRESSPAGCPLWLDGSSLIPLWDTGMEAILDCCAAGLHLRPFEMKWWSCPPATVLCVCVPEHSAGSLHSWTTGSAWPLENSVSYPYCCFRLFPAVGLWVSPAPCALAGGSLTFFAINVFYRKLLFSQHSKIAQ